MDKILVEVYLPAASRSFQIYIPVNAKLHEVLILLAATLTELSEGYFSSSEDTVICDRTSGTIFNINMSAAELGLYNGSKLMII
jgi:hypothetical protein